MLILEKKVGKKLKEKEIEGSIQENLEKMQDIVGGYIETITFPKEKIVLVCNEEGRLRNLPVNFFHTRIGHIYGDIFFVGMGEEDFVSLTKEQIQNLRNFFER